MKAASFLSLLLAASLGHLCSAFSAATPQTTTSSRTTTAPFQVVMPLQNHARQEDSSATDHFLHQAFHKIVDSSEYLIPQTGQTACDIPALGVDAQVSLTRGTTDSHNRSTNHNSPSKDDCFFLTVDGSEISNEDFGWICAKFYECKESFEETLDLSPLRSVVASHFSTVPPHPGFEPADFGNENLQHALNPGVLCTLKTQGYVVIDDAFPKAHPEQHAQLSAFLKEKTNQSSDTRRDTVHFLHQDEAKACGMQQHFVHLMSIATHLNRHLVLRASPHAAVAPATPEKPLTVPRAIQLAEYGKNDFYVAHSDNSLTPCGTLRNNFRHYTCILYLNSDWRPDMGGALRLYLNSRHYATPQQAVDECDFVDILPENGRLLIFDSCLVHAVRRVTQHEQTRRALTLWINRPNDSGVPGEVFY